MLYECDGTMLDAFFFVMARLALLSGWTHFFLQEWPTAQLPVLPEMNIFMPVCLRRPKKLILFTSLHIVFPFVVLDNSSMLLSYVTALQYKFPYSIWYFMNIDILPL